MKQYLFLVLSLGLVLFASCGNGLNNKPSDEKDEEITKITVESLPEGVYCIEIGTGLGYDFNRLTMITHDDVPYTHEYSSKDFYGDTFPSAGSTYTVQLSYDMFYGTVKGDEPLKVLNNGSALTEAVQTHYSADSLEEKKKKVNLLQYKTYVAQMTLAETNNITISKGGFGKIDGSKVRLDDTTGCSYVYFNMDKVNFTINTFGIDSNMCGTVYPNVYYVPANTNVSGLMNNGYGYWYKDLESLTGKCDNNSISLSFSKDNPPSVYFTSAAQGKVITFSGLELEPIADNLKLATKSFNSTYFRENNSDNFEEYNANIKVDLGTFTPGSCENPCIVTVNEKTCNAIWYYRDLNSIIINPVTFDNNVFEGFYKFTFSDNAYIGQYRNLNLVYFTDKVILGAENFKIDYQKNQSRIKLYWAKTGSEKLTFLGFTPDLSCEDENVFKHLKVHIDDSVQDRIMCEYGDNEDSNTSDYQYYTCYFMENSVDAGAGAVQFDSSSYNCDKEHTCYLVYYDDNGNEIARSETVKFVRNSDYVFSNVKVASMPQHLGDKLSITYNCNKTGFEVYTIIVRKSFGETFDITDYDKFMDYYYTRNYGRIDFATHNRFEVNSDEDERKYDIYFYAEIPTDIRVIKEPFMFLKDLTFDSMPGEFTLTEISGVPKTLPKAALYNQKFMLKLNFKDCNPYIETFPLGLTIHYYRDGGETGGGFGCPIEVTKLKNNIYELDLSDAYWDLSSVKHNYMDKDIYKFEIDVQIADQRRFLTYTIE